MPSIARRKKKPSTGHKKPAVRKPILKKNQSKK